MHGGRAEAWPSPLRFQAPLTGEASRRRTSSATAAVKLSVDSVVQTRNGYLAKIVAVNEGGMTAAGVVIEGELRRGTESVERSWTTIDYLPPRSEQRGGLFFTRDPRQFELQVRPFGYVEP